MRGGPLAAAVGHAVVRLLETEEYQQRARVLGERLRSRPEALLGDGVSAVRSVELWAGVDIDEGVMTGREACEGLAARGVLTKETHGLTLVWPHRLAPRRTKSTGWSISSRMFSPHGPGWGTP
jgi:ornithine--oxo-acid transaminase